MSLLDKFCFGVVGMTILGIACAMLLCGCSTTAGTTTKLPFEMGVGEAGVTLGFTGPLTGNRYEASVPVQVPAGLPISVKRPQTLEK